MHLLDDLALVSQRHLDLILQWKQHGIGYSSDNDCLHLVEKNHSFNYQLWHAEDQARRDDKGYEHVYLAKRAIDGFNQQRNNCMEAIDQYLFNALKPLEDEACPVHSETPGMIIDRLSILALKYFHMHIQTARNDVDTKHREQCLHKLSIIQQQQAQLQTCLTHLLHAIVEKTRTFRVYHQFKMYNDPTLNPALYSLQS